jgi:predicted ATPase
VHLLKNFKGFASAMVDLERPFTLLIGRNGSGKSNLIEAVEVLAQLAAGRALHDFSEVGVGVNRYGVRGGLPGCVRKGADSFELSFEAIGPPDVGDVTWSITVGGAREPRIVAESLMSSSRMIYNAKLDGDVLNVAYNNFRRGPNAPSVQLSAGSAVLPRCHEAFSRINRANENAKQAAQIVDALRCWLPAAFVFDPAPRAIRSGGYQRIGDSVLAKDGANLSSALYALRHGPSSDEAALDRILKVVRELPEEPFQKIDFTTTSTNDVLLTLVDGAGRSFDARLLSDGTLRTLAILAAIETAEAADDGTGNPPVPLIVVEEFDNGLHSSRVKTVLNAAYDAAKNGRARIVATTHNPALLDALTPEQLKCVVVCHHDAAAKAATMTPLLDLPGADVLLERGRLGDLVTREIIDEHFDPEFESKRTEAARKWLRSLT